MFVVLWYAVDVKLLVDNIHTIQATAFKNMTENKSHEHNKDYSKQRNRMHCLWDILYRISYIADIKFSAITFLKEYIRKCHKCRREESQPVGISMTFTSDITMPNDFQKIIVAGSLTDCVKKCILAQSNMKEDIFLYSDLR